MSDNAILRALLERLHAYVTALPVAYLGKEWDGSTFKPPGSGMWLESQYLPNRPEDFTWAEDDVVSSGVFQVSVYFRHDVFETLARQEAANVAAHFEKGRQLTGEVRIQQTGWPAAIVQGKASSHIPVSIDYRGVS